MSQNLQKEKIHTGIAVGKDSGFITTWRVPRERPSRRKGALGKRVKMIREVIREVVGFAPYEKRIQDILKSGGNKNPVKTACRFARRRMGSHRRAKRKVIEMRSVNARVAMAEAQLKAQEEAENEKTNE